MSELGFRGARLLTRAVLDAGSAYAGSETDEHSAERERVPLSRQPSRDVGESVAAVPTLKHRLRLDSSVLAIVLSDHHIYAGTQNGEIVVYTSDTFEQQAVIEGHRGSVLSLCLSKDQKLLFSGAGDRIVNVWHTSDLSRAFCLYSPFDVGDVFCVAYSAALQTVYLGAQNTTIQWHCWKDEESETKANTSIHPSLRDDRFFDSPGPGGIKIPGQAPEAVAPRHATGGRVVEVDKFHVREFAHYGYVLCMLLPREGVPESGGREVLITGGGDGAVKVWTLDSNRGGAIDEWYHLDDGREEGHAIHSMALEGTLLYTGRSGGEIDVWDLETRQLVRNFKAHRDDVLAISVGEGFMFSAAVTGHVRKFDKQYRLKSRFKAHDGRILSSAFAYHQGRPVYVTGGSDSTLAVWDVNDCNDLVGATTTATSNEQLIEYLRRFVSYKTVSSEPQHQVDCRRGASFLRATFKNFGASTEMLPTPQPYNPVILARFRGNPATRAKRKTILFYGHYDVVAADNSRDKWLNDPFSMEGIDGYLYGRGTSDNKGPIMAAIFACAELTSEQALGSDVVFLIEGEEECGSRGFEKAVQENKDKIGSVDWILLANSYWLDDRVPCLTYGLRGVIHATVQVESSHPDLHSGVDGSADLDEPLKDLVVLLNSLLGKHGRVQIPGFYDPIPDLTPAEMELYTDITTTLLSRNPGLGEPLPLAESLMRRWRDATLTIHRFQTSGPDNATIIPRRAKAALSMRLVPNQEAAEVSTAFQSHLRSEFEKLDSTNNLTVTIDHQAEPWLGDWNNQIFQTLEEAIMEAWGPIGQPRRRSMALPTTLQPLSRHDSDSSNGDCALNKPRPATSAVLASGSATPKAARIAVISDVNDKLSDVAATQDRRRSGHVSSKSTSAAHHSPSQRRKPLYIREGGSIPAIRFLEKEFDAPAAHLPCGQASDSAHLDNERLRLLNLYKSRDIFKKVFRDLPVK